MDSEDGDKEVFADHLPDDRMTRHLRHHLRSQFCQEHVGHEQLAEEWLGGAGDDVQEVGSGPEKLHQNVFRKFEENHQN